MHNYFKVLSKLAGRPLTFPYADTDLAALENALSSARLARYQAAFGGDRLKALECHYWNTRLSQLLYFPLQMYEITLRNALDRELSAGLGENWLVREQHWLRDHRGTTNWQRSDIESARHKLRRANKSVTHSSILSRLGLNFWTELLNSHYDDVLWRKYLRFAFPNYSGPRGKLYIHLKNIRHLRNRICHCQHVLFSCAEYLCSPDQMKGKYSAVLQAIEWMSTPGYAWVKDNALFESAADEFIQQYYCGQSLRRAEVPVKSFDSATNYGFVLFGEDKQEAILHGSVLGEHGPISAGFFVTCEASPTVNGWRVTRVLSSRPPRTSRAPGMVSKKLPKVGAFARVEGEEKEVLIPARAMSEAGVIDLNVGDMVDVLYVESARGLRATEMKLATPTSGSGRPAIS